MNSKGVIISSLFSIIAALFVIWCFSLETSYAEPDYIYQVYLDGEKIGLIDSKDNLYDLINHEQTEIKDDEILVRVISDSICMSSYKAAIQGEDHKRVPEDISVIGFDGVDIGRYMMPRLTTIRQHREAIATRSVEVLLGCIEGKMKKVREIEAFHLIPGESVRAK